MKALQEHVAFNRMQNTGKRHGKNEIASVISEKSKKSSARSTLVVLLMCNLIIAMCGCGKPSNNPTPPVVSPTGCAIASDVDETLGLRNFQYDDKGLLTKVTAPNYYYGTFVRTITSAKTSDVFTGYSAVYDYSGGSGNIYDGDPEFIHELSVADSLSQFKYDGKKRLVSILVPTPANGYLGNTHFTIFRYELNFTYDANDNVTQVKIVQDYQEKTIVPGTGVSHIDYLQVSDDELNITYDDKPSPYTAISKYWKFIGADYLHFKIYSLNLVRFWANYCAVLSKNNPVKIMGKLISNDALPPNTVNATLTYQYNEKDFPVTMAINGASVNAFTYNCK